MMLLCLSFTFGKYVGVSFDLFIGYYVESTRHLDISVDRVVPCLFTLLTWTHHEGGKMEYFTWTGYEKDELVNKRRLQPKQLAQWRKSLKDQPIPW